MAIQGWTAVAYWVGAGIILVGMVGGPFLPERRHQRRVYWCSWLVGGTLLVGILGGGDARWTATFAVPLAVLSVLIAYFKSPYIKIGGKIYALSLEDRQPDPPREGEPAADPVPRPEDSYGHLTPATVWWLLAVFLTTVTIMVVDLGWTSRSIWAAGTIVLFFGSVGIADGRGRFPRFRRQYAPTVVALLASIPMFMAPTALYLLTYELGRLLPATSRSTPQKCVTRP